ncbi:MAG TPA: aminotransferase class I/II-fold pyridoxal phosphate-dependent enzyme [Planctomycetota bacterium]|nr:aminotransferase class I/II-fold pyridoxal phosphate-dependent enzyme [Planctomycetota bacterium]
MTATTSAALTSFLIEDARERPGDDPIFFLNAEAQRRARAGERIINATLGALVEDDGILAILPSVGEAISRVKLVDAASYAPIAGEPGFLSAVIRDLYHGRAQGERSVAVATPGGTGALHHAIVNFLDPGEALLTTKYYWGPYKTIADHTRRRVETFEMFDAAGRFDTKSFQVALERQVETQKRALVILNTPCHNPTGYSLDAREWAGVCEALRHASLTAPVSLCVDYAYAHFGGRSEKWLEQVETLGERVLLLCAWTASKSFAQYGARIGALVASHSDASERTRIHNALSYSCRGTWSNCNHLGMLAIADLMNSPESSLRIDAERQRLVDLLGARVQAFNAAARASGLKYPRYEGGFFVTVFSKDPQAEAKHMRENGVYVVPIAGALRVALCSTPVSAVPELVRALAAAQAACGG